MTSHFNPGAASKFILSVFALAVIGGAFPAQTAQAQENPAAMTCDQLWYARNSLYAQTGYCFKTARARSVFGPGCFPPYGKLDGWQQQRISEFSYWERRRGC